MAQVGAFWQPAGWFSPGSCREKPDSAGVNRSRKSGVFLLHSLIRSRSWRAKEPLLAGPLSSVWKFKGSVCEAGGAGPRCSNWRGSHDGNVEKGRCRLGFLPSEGQPEGPGYWSSSWFGEGWVSGRVWALEGVGVGGIGNLSGY